MNLYPFRFFIRQSSWGKSYQLLKQLQAEETFNRAHFRVFIPHRDCARVIIALGQKHTVLTGKVSKWTAKTIARCQARLYTYYRYFYNVTQIHFFGEEGITHAVTEGFFRYQLDDLNKAIPPLESEKISSGKITLADLKKILIRLALKWQSMLNILCDNPDKIAPYANLVSGSLLYSKENSRVLYFAIEGEKAYRFTLNKIRELEQEINRAKAVPAYQKAVYKKFNKLTPEEYQAVMNCHQKIKMFNKILGSSVRDEATLKSMLDRLRDSDVLIYTIGLAHEKNLFQLAKTILQENNVALIMILAPELWFWRGVIQWVKRIIFLSIIIACILLFWWFK